MNRLGAPVPTPVAVSGIAWAQVCSAALAVGSIVCGCSRASNSATTPAPENSEVVHVQPEPRPRLLVAVVFDQLGSDTLLRSLETLEPEGVLRTAVREGSFFERAEYPYINTLTAPGHAAIFTGAPPRVSGIGGNEEWDDAAATVVPTVHSPGHRVFGDDQQAIGPSMLRVPTVAEMLSRATQGKAGVVSVSLKDRAAVFSVGREPDAALWFDSTLGQFTSSTFCTASMPAWLERWQQAHPIDAVLGRWQPLADYTALLGPDDAIGENNFWGSTFPHDPRLTDEPLKTARMLPALSERLVELAEAARQEHRLGEDEVNDLLVVSISGTDYVGHVYGPHSWEYLDHLRRADLAVGRWLARLSKQYSLNVAITSDHGVAPLPERALAHGHDAGRLFRGQLTEHLEAKLDAQFGPQDWVAAMIGGFVYFTRETEARPDLGVVLAASARVLLELPGVERVFSAREAAGWVGHTDPLLAAAANSFPEGGAADLLIDTRRYWIFGYGAPPGTGTHHGSKQPYDQQVPVLFYGPSVSRRRVSGPVNQLRVAPTLAALLGVPPPPQAQLEPLPLTD